MNELEIIKQVRTTFHQMEQQREQYLLCLHRLNRLCFIIGQAQFDRKVLPLLQFFEIPAMEQFMEVCLQKHPSATNIETEIDRLEVACGLRNPTGSHFQMGNIAQLRRWQAECETDAGFSSFFWRDGWRLYDIVCNIQLPPMNGRQFFTWICNKSGVTADRLLQSTDDRKRIAASVFYGLYGYCQ